MRSIGGIDWWKDYVILLVFPKWICSSCLQSGFVSIKREAVMHPIMGRSNSRKNIWRIRHSTVGLKLEKPPSQYPVTVILGSPPQIRYPLIKLRRFQVRDSQSKILPFYSCRNIQHRTWWRSFQPTFSWWTELGAAAMSVVFVSGQFAKSKNVNKVNKSPHNY